MKSKTPKILILGANGMLGRTAYAYLSTKYPSSTWGTSRKRVYDNFFYLTAEEIIYQFDQIIEEIGEVDFVINCIGVLKNSAEDYSINYSLSRSIEHLMKKHTFKFIHISTDDVFNPLVKFVDEKTKPNPNNPYALSKLKGEAISVNSITIRTSIIGFDPIEKKGILEWCIKSKNKQVNGYVNQLWTGSTTLQLAEFFAFLIKNNNFTSMRKKTSVLHFVPLGPISKYGLVKVFSNKLDLNIVISKTNSTEPVTRVLHSRYLDKKFLKKFKTNIGGAVDSLIRFENRASLTSVKHWENSPILITGGAGYIGATLVETLLRDNKKVRIFDKFISKNAFEDVPNKKYLEIFEGDITNTKDVSKAVKGASSVVHLAGIVGDKASDLDKKLTRKVNILGTRFLKEAAQKEGVSSFLFASSCSVYGASKNVLTEKSRPNPLSFYSDTKLISERDLLESRNSSFHPTVLRLATIFGLSKKPRFDLVANLFVAQAYFNKRIEVLGGSQWRPFIHVSDVARAINLILSADKKKVSGQIFNVGDDSLVLTINNLAKIIKNSLKNHSDVKIIKKEMQKNERNYKVSFKKIKNIIGFESEKTIQDGALEMVNYFKNNPLKIDVVTGEATRPERK